jgi:hypothetical protein
VVYFRVPRVVLLDDVAPKVVRDTRVVTHPGSIARTRDDAQLPAK